MKSVATHAPTAHIGDRPPHERESGGPDVRTRKPKEIGGPRGPEPTRYGDWERNGRCIDF
jgi:hypothetical protein